MLAAHYSDERGVVLDSRSWLITAWRRPPGTQAKKNAIPRIV